MNITYFMGGIFLISLGSLSAKNYSEFKYFTRDFGAIIPFAIVFSGLFMIIVAFLGCCGSVKESPCMLLLYCSGLIITCALQLVTGVTTFLKLGDLEKRLIYGLHVTFKQYAFDFLEQTTENHLSPQHFEELLPNDIENDLENLDLENLQIEEQDLITLDHRAEWPILQMKMKCCGINSSEDWSTSINYIPTSCQSRQKNDGSVFELGCQPALVENLTNHFHLLATVMVVFCLIEFLGILLSCSLFTNTKKTPYNIVDELQSKGKIQQGK